MKNNLCPVCKCGRISPAYYTCSIRCERIFYRYNGNPWPLFGVRHRLTPKGMRWLRVIEGIWLVGSAIFWVFMIWATIVLTHFAFSPSV